MTSTSTEVELWASAICTLASGLFAGWAACGLSGQAARRSMADPRAGLEAFVWAYRRSDKFQPAFALTAVASAITAAVEANQHEKFVVRDLRIAVAVLFFTVIAYSIAVVVPHVKAMVQEHERSQGAKLEGAGSGTALAPRDEEWVVDAMAKWSAQHTWRTVGGIAGFVCMVASTHY